jgi:hypothetical protein
MGHGWHDVAAGAERPRAVNPGIAQGAADRIRRRAGAWMSSAVASARCAWRPRFARWSHELLETRGSQHALIRSAPGSGMVVASARLGEAGPSVLPSALIDPASCTSASSCVSRSDDLASCRREPVLSAPSPTAPGRAAPARRAARPALARHQHPPAWGSPPGRR